MAFLTVANGEILDRFPDNLNLMTTYLPSLFKLTAEMDSRLLALLAFLAFLLTLLAWKLVEGLAAVFFELAYSLTPKGRLVQKQRHEAIAAEVDAIMAKINSTSALFQGPPKPPARWKIWLVHLGRVALVGLIGLWSYGAWHFYQSAQSTATLIAAEEARNPLLISSLRGLHNDEPGKTYAVAAFLALQVLAIVMGIAWQWYKALRATHENPLTNSPPA
jgi:hypothetical protein